MTDMTSLLVELGTEELPVTALTGLAQAFFDGVLAGLAKHGIAVERGHAQPLFTPRRLVVLLPGVALQQPRQCAQVPGPYLSLALDADGQPTKALQGFAAKVGVHWTALERIDDARGERFVHRAVTPGARTAQLLPQIVREAIAAMPIPKPMRWGAHDYAFARPVHWLVLLLGQEVVQAEVLGVKAGRMSRGHRFMHGKTIRLNTPEEYLPALEAAQVLADPQVRRARIVAQVEAAARQAGGHARISQDNLERVVNLVEWPSAVRCGFEHAFLAVPQEALIQTMESNQTFFPVLDDSGKLTEQFIGIANIVSRDAAAVAKGYERVIRPRFADAKFFFDEDLKQGLLAMGEGLETVTYHARLGTLADKTGRVAWLAKTIAAQVGVDPGCAERAARLSKNDLQSRMVNEFPELQGIAGRYYAKAAGEPDEIALAIDEAYRPRVAGDGIAASPLGQVLAIAERLDTLAGGFQAGLAPTGNKDPFKLRRAALGLARTMIESGLDLDLVALLDQALDAVAFAQTQQQDKQASQTAAKAAALGAQAHAIAHVGGTTLAQRQEIFDFILDRLRGYYLDKGVPATHFNAVAALQPRALHDFDRRLAALGLFAALPEAAALAAANKRIRNILRKTADVIPGDIDPALLCEPAEQVLAEAVEGALGDTDDALHRHDYVAVLTRLARLRPQVDAFFDAVMVHVEDRRLRANRLALLKRLGDRLGSVAAIEHLSPVA